MPRSVTPWPPETGQLFGLPRPLIALGFPALDVTLWPALADPAKRDRGRERAIFDAAPKRSSGKAGFANNVSGR